MFQYNDWNIEAMTGYKPKTTFYMDFSIADHYGLKAVKDTFNKVFAEWKDDIEYVTELAMALNWKSWEHSNNPEYCEFYANRYYEVDGYVLDGPNKFSQEDITYYLQTTD